MSFPFGPGPDDPRPIAYAPKWDTVIERHPDKLQSSARLDITDRGEDVIALMEVRGCGVLVMRAVPVKNGTGELEAVGISLFTDDELKFD